MRRLPLSAPTHFKRLFLRNLAWQVNDDETFASLFDALKAAARAKLSETENGTVLTGSSANGASVTFTLPDGASLTAQDVTEMCSELLDLYEATVEALTALSGPSDVQIIAAMLDAIGQPVRRFHSRFTSLHG